MNKPSWESTLAGLSARTKDQIITNVHDIATALHNGQHRHTKGFLAAVTQHVDTHEASLVTSFPQDTIRHAKREFDGDKMYTSPLFAERATKTGPGSRPRGASKKADALKFLERTKRVTKSGDETDRFESWESMWSSHDVYKRNGGTAGYTLFAAAWEELKVKRAKHAEYDYFSCIVCKDAQVRITELEETIASQRKNPPSQLTEFNILVAQGKIAVLKVRGKSQCAQHCSQHVRRHTFPNERRKRPCFSRRGASWHKASYT